MKKLFKNISAFLHKKNSIKFYSSFAEASKNSTTYFDVDIATIVTNKTINLKNSIQTESVKNLDSQLTQNHFILYYLFNTCDMNDLEVIDWGGAAGATYFQLEKLFDKIIRQWNVIDTPFMVEAARQLENPKLKFYKTISE